MDFCYSILDLKMIAIRKHKTYSLITTIVIFFALYFVSKIYLQDMYLFEWTQRHYYLGMWIIAIGLILGNRILISFSISVGNFVGVLLGQYVGDWIKELTMSQIVSGMDPETVYQLQHHPGVEIWLLTIGIFFLIGAITTLIWKRKITSTS